MNGVQQPRTDLCLSIDTAEIELKKF